MARTHNILPPLSQPLRKAAASAGCEVSLPTYLGTRALAVCSVAQPPKRGLEGCGHRPCRGEDAAFYVCGPRMGGCMGGACLPQMPCISRGELLIPRMLQEALDLVPPRLWSLCLHKSAVTPQKSMEKGKHMKKKFYPREPEQPEALQRQERYLSLKEGWIPSSARVNSQFLWLIL